MPEPTLPLAPTSGAAKCGMVIVNYRSSHLLGPLLQNLEEQRAGAQLVVVVDNFSSYPERDAAAAVSSGSGAHFIAMDTNAGFGTACNIGAREALEHGATGVLFLNPDTRVRPGALSALSASAEADESAIISPLILRGAGPDAWFLGGVLNEDVGIASHAHAAGTPIAWLSGCALYVPAEVWALLRGFDERFFLYWEDVELTYRWRRSGGRLTLCEEAVVEHDVGGTQGAGSSKSSLYFRYNCRNRLLFLALHGDSLSTWRVIRGTAAHLRWLRGLGLAARPRSLTTLFAALRGVCEGASLYVRVPSTRPSADPRF